jgi:magnesium transporter
MKLKKAIKDEIEVLGLSRLFPKRGKKAGKAPGTVQYTGERREGKVEVELIDYTKSNLKEKFVDKIEETFKVIKTGSSSWVNINGVYDTELIEKIGENFKIHSLVLEDIANVNQQPKFEDYGDYIYFVLKMLRFDNDTKEVRSEQVSIILGKNFVLTFQESRGDVFDSIRKRIRNENSRLRKFGNDYLAYALIDAIVDNYFVVLEKMGENVEGLEQEVLLQPGQEVQQKIYKLKREVILVRKSVWPLREVVGGLQRSDSKLISKDIIPYVRDVYDHTIQVIDTVETFRDILSSMLDLYLSSVSNRMNEVMKVLTIIATIFIPLTFIAGIYGMNFDYMPELAIWWFYPLVWGVMIAVALLMILYFKRKKWI